MDYQKILLEMVGKLVSGVISVPHFRDIYYDFYLEQVPDNVMADRDYEFFGQLQDKLDWTDSDPSAEERLWGWFSQEDYREWVTSRLSEYLAGEDSG